MWGRVMLTVLSRWFASCFIVLSHNNQSRSHSYSLSHHEMYTSRQCRALRARHVQIDEDLIGPAADTYFNRYAVGWLLLSAADLTRPCVCVRHAQKRNAVSVCVWRERTGRVVIACTTCTSWILRRQHLLLRLHFLLLLAAIFGALQCVAPLLSSV